MPILDYWARQAFRESERLAHSRKFAAEAQHYGAYITWQRQSAYSELRIMTLANCLVEELERRAGVKPRCPVCLDTGIVGNTPCTYISCPKARKP